MTRSAVIALLFSIYISAKRMGFRMSLGHMYSMTRLNLRHKYVLTCTARAKKAAEQVKLKI